MEELRPLYFWMNEKTAPRASGIIPTLQYTYFTKALTLYPKNR